MDQEQDSQSDNSNQDNQSAKREFFLNTPSSQPKKSGKKIWIILVVLIIIVIAAGFFFRHQLKSMVAGGNATPTPAPSAEVTTEPTPTPNPLVRSDWTVEVLNGTSTSGLAKTVADKIQNLGYRVVKVGNADKSNYSASEIFVKKDLSDKTDLVIADLKDVIKIASVGAQLQDSTASARIVIGKDAI